MKNGCCGVNELTVTRPQVTMIRQENLTNIHLSNRMFLFRPCVGSNKYPGIVCAAQELLPKLGVQPEISDDQTCCGGFLTFTNVAEPNGTMPAVARNFCVMEQAGLDAIALCNGCFTFLNDFRDFMNRNVEARTVVNMVLSLIDREYEGTSKVYHIFEVLLKVKDRISENVIKPLSGLKFAVHYGCHYLFAHKKKAVDDPFMPTGIEEIIEILGGEAVPYTEHRSCCGTGLTQVILNKEEVSLPHTMMKLNSIQDASPDAVVVICPYCLSQLDRMQHKLNLRREGKYAIPVMHLTQLVALGFGVAPEKLGLGAHNIPFDDLMKKL